MSLVVKPVMFLRLGERGQSENLESHRLMYSNLKHRFMDMHCSEQNSV